MAEAKQPSGPTGVLESYRPWVCPYRREKLRALSHDAVYVPQERRRGTGRRGAIDPSIAEALWAVDRLREARFGKPGLDGVMMLDHVSPAVADYRLSWAFYDQVLATLGHKRS